MGFRQFFRDLRDPQAKKAAHSNAYTVNRIEELESEVQTLRMMVIESQGNCGALTREDTPEQGSQGVPEHVLRRSQSAVKLNQNLAPHIPPLRHKRSAPVISPLQFQSHYNKTPLRDLNRQNILEEPNEQGQPFPQQQKEYQSYQQQQRQRNDYHPSKENQPQKAISKEHRGYKIHGDNRGPGFIQARIPEPIATSTITDTWRNKNTEPERHATVEQVAQSIITHGPEFGRDISESEFGSHWGNVLRQQRAETATREARAMQRVSF